jgi:hypothetical protein
MIRVNIFTGGGTLVVSALMLAACGGSTGNVATAPTASSPGTTSDTTPVIATPTGASTASDPCTLVTSQEASVALGVDAGTPNSSAGQCNYTTAAGDMTIIDTVYPDSTTARTSFDATRTAAKGGVPGFQDVTGIGDLAFLTSSGLIEFAKGSTVVTIQVLSSGNPSPSTMTALGQAAAGRV